MGCIVATISSNMHDEEKVGNCPFCRESANDVEHDKRMMKRVKANDPAAMREVGAKCYDKGDYDGAFEHYTKAAELGNVDAHARLGCMYWEGEGVEKDWKKSIYHWERAAIGGHPSARYFLAVMEASNGNVERAVKHLIISANLGHEESMKKLWRHYSLGNITKEDLDATLRTHHAAVDAMKSEQRDAAEVIFKQAAIDAAKSEHRDKASR